MAELGPEIVDEVVEACKAGAEEAAEGFQRGLDMEGATLSVGQPGTVDMKALPEELSGPGLAVVLSTGGTAAVILLPESFGVLPSWYEDPDPTGQSKLTTLAQELGMILLPKQYMPDDFMAARAKHLAGALARGGVSDGAAVVPLEIQRADGKQAVAQMIWPAPNPNAVIGSGAAKPKPEPKPKPAAGDKMAGKPKPVPTPRRKPAPRHATVAGLPPYSRSLLRIRVPIVVTLAQKNQPLGRVLEMGPGSIIQFDKSCEEMLDLDIGNRRVATGEAVKVGDKFGLRITSVVLPDERFHAVTPGE